MDCQSSPPQDPSITDTPTSAAPSFLETTHTHAAPPPPNHTLSSPERVPVPTSSPPLATEAQRVPLHNGPSPSAETIEDSFARLCNELTPTNLNDDDLFAPNTPNPAPPPCGTPSIPQAPSEADTPSQTAGSTTAWRVRELEDHNASLLERLLRERIEKGTAEKNATVRIVALEQENASLTDAEKVATRAAGAAQVVARQAEARAAELLAQVQALRHENADITEQLKATRVRLSKRVREIEAERDELEARLAMAARHTRGPASVRSGMSSPTWRGDGLQDDNAIRARLLELHGSRPPSGIPSRAPSVPGTPPLSRSMDGIYLGDDEDSTVAARRRRLRKLFIEEIHCPRYRNVRAAWIDWFGPDSSEVAADVFAQRVARLEVPGLDLDDIDALRREVLDCNSSLTESRGHSQAISWAHFVKYYQITKQ